MNDETVRPKTAVEEFLEAKAPEVADTTIQNLRYRLKQFVIWTGDVDIDDMHQLVGRDCEQWKLARAQDGLAPLTIRNHMRTFRQFIRWCGVVGYCDSDLHEFVLIPEVSKDEQRRDDAISYKRGNRIRSYLHQFEYASRRHVTFALIWHTGMRMGSARALDTDHIERGPDETMYLEVRHRPETDTPLKLGKEGERNVTIADPELASSIEDYIKYQRPPVEDDYGRKPLLATQQGRASKTTIRTDVYQASHPCVMDFCPHGEQRETCDHVSRIQSGGCPSAIGPHGVRRSAITAHLNQGVPKEIVSERASVSVDTLEDHYDVRTQEQARKTRQQYVEDLRF